MSKVNSTVTSPERSDTSQAANVPSHGVYRRCARPRFEPVEIRELLGVAGPGRSSLSVSATGEAVCKAQARARRRP